MTFLRVITLFSIFIFSHLSLAADDLAPPTFTKSEKKSSVNNNQKIPTIPNEVDDSRNIPQPEVRIIRKKDTVIEEYRVNGRLRFVKITPTSGSPYYMVDTDGDGVLETREDNFSNPPINQWILLEW